MKSLHFDEATHLTRRPPSGIDAVTTLEHFAIITYLVSPAALRPHIDNRFELDCVTAADGTEKALISVVPFLDRDFRFVRFPFYKSKFGQTNYRAYVTDRTTGEHVAWFFGTSLASWTVNIPRYIWRLPWHPAKIDFDMVWDKPTQRYTRYRFTTDSDWAPAQCTLEDSGEAVQQLGGFPNLETALVLLTHPLKGYYYRRDGRLGSYSIWHDKLQLTYGRATQASFPLLDRLGLVKNGDLSTIHSVLIQPATEFTIYLPPKRV